MCQNVMFNSVLSTLTSVHVCPTVIMQSSLYVQLCNSVLQRPMQSCCSLQCNYQCSLCFSLEVNVECCSII